jgi:hypothetical protein
MTSRENDNGDSKQIKSGKSKVNKYAIINGNSIEFYSSSGRCLLLLLLIKLPSIVTHFVVV